MTKYVVGFVFDPALKRVALIIKNKPDWQKGLLNGIGGKIEDGESCYEAMTREFREETSLTVTVSAWTLIAIMQGIGWKVNVLYYVTKSNKEFNKIRTMETEEVVWHSVSNMHEPMGQKYVSNLYWLIPMCLDDIRYEGTGYVVSLNIGKAPV